ncbi:uncharacterized protein KQ657_000697 [Scheffersomyces spartinae]|uniref:Uncharacterized protein n=1 Tax=Scheffersomyces spartinae TaxID=45513 RepID=A0A9P7V9D0_9ASCO|nr:uncharacterized protein KQ657_000697 [Scheffersomyces spartinae]KAG7193624.1 hypothetical protein KQ657_000697 [Scheffersomyces spartinae]
MSTVCCTNKMIKPYYPQSQYVAPLHFYPHMSYGVPPPLPSAPLPATIPLFGNLASAPTAVVPTPTNHVLGSTSSTSDSSPASISSNANSNNNSNGITAAGSPPLPLSQSSETLKLPTSEFRPKRRPRPLELRYSFMASAPSLADTTKTPVTTSSALTTPTPSSMSSSLQVPSSVSTSHMHQDEVHGLKSAPPTSSFSAAYARSSIISPLSPLFHQLFHQVKQQPASSLSVENKENIGSVATAFGTPGPGTGVVLPPVATSFSPLHIPPIRSSKNWLSGVLNGTSSTTNGNANPGNTITGTTSKPVQSGDDDMVVDGTSQENGTIKGIEIKCEGVKHGEVHKEEGNNITKTNEDSNNTNSNNNNGSNNIDVDVDVDNVGTATTTTNRVIEKRQSIRNLLS